MAPKRFGDSPMCSAEYEPDHASAMAEDDHTVPMPMAEDDHAVPMRRRPAKDATKGSAAKVQQSPSSGGERWPQQQQPLCPESAVPTAQAPSHLPYAWDQRCLLGRRPADVRADFAFGAALGEGQSGQIRQCVHRATGQVLACKTVSKATIKGPAYAELLCAEVAALESLAHHPHVVRLVATYEDDLDVHLVMEYCSGGDLFERVKQVKLLPEADAAEVAARLAKTLRSCQRRGLIHRDLKLENILLASGPSNTDIRVADFGVATFVRPGEKLMAKNGTPLYMAPEVLDGYYGKECDIWSAGVILYILLCGVPPFWRPDDAGIFAAIRAGRINTVDGPWRGVSRAAKDLVHRMLCVDPSRRITVKEILAHPWILKHTSLQVPVINGAALLRQQPVCAEQIVIDVPVAAPLRRDPRDRPPPEDHMESDACCPGGAAAGTPCRPASERRVKWRRSMEIVGPLEQLRVK